MNNFTGYLFIIIVVLFQHEIRRALAFLGETRVFGSSAKAKSVILDEIVKAATILANRQIGALIVLQRDTDLVNFLDDTGTKLDCEISREVLISIFIPYSPLHDGAVIISNGRISTAGSILPLTRQTDLGKNYGTSTELPSVLRKRQMHSLLQSVRRGVYNRCSERRTLRRAGCRSAS